jgi:hypothetical protein
MEVSTRAIVYAATGLLLAVSSLCSWSSSGAELTPAEICTHHRREAERICNHPQGAQYCQQIRSETEAACAAEYKKEQSNAAVGLDENARGQDWQAAAETHIYSSNRQCNVVTRLMKFEDADHWGSHAGGAVLSYLDRNDYDSLISEYVRRASGTRSVFFARWLDEHRGYVKKACDESFKTKSRVLIGSYDAAPGSPLRSRAAGD